MSETDRPASHDVGRRIMREAMPAERERGALLRAAVEHERPEIVAWARREMAHAEGNVAVGLVLSPEEASATGAASIQARLATTIARRSPRFPLTFRVSGGISRGRRAVALRPHQMV